jgi:hypothetical protein
MVSVQFKGGMGNQMFQYAIGRILAEAKGHKLEILDPDKRQELLLKQFPATNIPVEGKEIRESTMSVAHDLQYMDFEAVKNHGGHVFLHGYWQKHYYYTPYKDKVREWFAYDDSQFAKPDPEDLVLHVRLGDQLKPEPIGLPESSETYVELLKKIPHKKCILISDELDSPFLDPVKKFPTVVPTKGSQMGDFTMLKYAKRAIISQSTYAWWATFLGNPDKVWAPLSHGIRRCLWKVCPAVQDIDLIPLDNTYEIFKIA